MHHKGSIYEVYMATASVFDPPVLIFCLTDSNSSKDYSRFQEILFSSYDARIVYVF
jgi:hypothetical protein